MTSAKLTAWRGSGRISAVLSVSQQFLILWASLGVVGGLFLVQTARLSFARRAPGRKSKARNERAQKGEQRAVALLQRRGYRVIERQVQLTYPVVVNGKEWPITVRADYLARKKGRTFVVEVKTGSLASSLQHGPTRRQLLEYRVAFSVDGVLLACPESHTLTEIGFPALSPAAARSTTAARPMSRWLLAIALTVTCVAVWIAQSAV